MRIKVKTGMVSNLYNYLTTYNPAYVKARKKKTKPKKAGKQKSPTHSTYGYVYYIYNRDSNAIKIGFTSSTPEGRLKKLQTGSACELKLLAYRRGYMSHEAHFHSQLTKYRASGEWFYVEKESLAIMREQLTKCSIKDKNILIPLIETSLKQIVY